MNPPIGRFMKRTNSARPWSTAVPCRCSSTRTPESGRGLPHSKTLAR